MELFVGTSGFAYKAWKPSFYPPKLPEKQFLRFYGERFRSVEINNSFYRMPKAEQLSRWASEVPAGFRFVLKASRRISHHARLKDVADPVAFLFKEAEALGEKLGVVLVQTPPHLAKDCPRLESFLELIPPGRRIALELQHPTWDAPEVAELLKEAGAARVAVDKDDEDPDRTKAAFAEPRSDFGYLRLRRCAYTDEALDVWHERIRATGWREVYVFFKHEDEGTGPELGRRFLDRLARAGSVMA